MTFAAPLPTALTADDDDWARQIAAGNPHIKAVFRRTITVGPWIEVKS